MYVFNFLLLIIFGSSFIYTNKINIDNNACKSFPDYLTWYINPNCYFDPDAFSRVEDIVKRHNYTFNYYQVTTEDGYILSLFRVRSKKVGITQKSPVYVQHGLATNAGCFTGRGSESLAFVLADNGYDVWLGNIRGTTYCSSHVHLSIKKNKFWDFGLDEMSRYDIHSSLSRVAQETGQYGNIIYLGHSLGTTLSYLYVSAYPELANQTLKGIVSMSPTASLKGVYQFDILAPPIIAFFETIRTHGLFYNYEVLHQLGIVFCRSLPHICLGGLELIFGKTNQLAAESLLTYFFNWPTGTSLKTFKHLLQLSRKGVLRKYDYGHKKNKQMYGNRSPPRYELENIEIPIYLLYSNADSLSTPQNTQRLFNILGSKRKEKLEIPPKNDKKNIKFNHIDFLYGKNMSELLYKPLISALQFVQS